MLKLYAADYCPYCKKVRDAFENMGIEFTLVPSEPGTPGREELLKIGGKGQVPFLVDDIRGENLYESDDIISYAKDHYGSKKD